jgi:hypothetical protein
VGHQISEVSLVEALLTLEGRGDDQHISLVAIRVSGLNLACRVELLVDSVEPVLSSLLGA